MARAFSRLVRKKIAVACMITIVIVYSGGIFAPWLAPYGYSDQDYTVIRQAPSIETGKGLTGLWSESHWAGTDRAGRDLFTRVLWGIQNTLIITVARNGHRWPSNRHNSGPDFGVLWQVDRRRYHAGRRDVRVLPGHLPGDHPGRYPEAQSSGMGSGPWRIALLYTGWCVVVLWTISSSRWPWSPSAGLEWPGW